MSSAGRELRGLSRAIYESGIAFGIVLVRIDEFKCADAPPTPDSSEGFIMALRIVAGLAAVLLAALFPPTGLAAELEPEIRRQLRTYYDDEKLPPPWRKAMDQLSAEDGKARAEAARYLVALL